MRNVVISGATGGLGRALTIAFLESGDRVYALGRNEKALADIEDQKALEIIPCDFLDQDSLAQACRLLEGIAVDIVINAAATDCGVAEVFKVPMKEWDTTFKVNLFSAVQLNNAVIPGMISKQSGSIINVTSSTAFAPLPWLSAYSASKAALHSYTKSLSLELKKYKIRANSLGILADTKLLQSHKNQKQVGGYYNQYPAHPRLIPKADDNIAPFIFLTSDAAIHVTGQYIECFGF